MKNKNFSVKTLNLTSEDVKSGMCVYPKSDINIEGVTQKSGDACIVFTNMVDFYKRNAHNYTWQKINHFKQPDRPPVKTDPKFSNYRR